MEPPQAFCPACKEEVAFISHRDGKACPKCGATFDVDASAILSEAPAPPPHTGRTWLVLLAVLMAPPTMTFLASLLRTEQASVGIAIIGSGVAALFGAIWLAMRLNLQIGLRVGLAILLAPVFYGACFVLCFAGCALGGGGFKVGG